MDQDSNQKNLEIWKVKKLIKNLDAAKGNGTSMISLIISPRDQISRITKMLADEVGTATNIKSRVNRQSVLSAITSTQQKLKLYNKVPPNGLLLYCGTCLTEDGKEKKVVIDFEPFKPINTSLYMCDNKFHTEALNDLIDEDRRFGFIIMDGNGTLFGSLCGNTREVLHKISVDLPKKHGRGGQSALRFSRLRLEKRHNYVRKVAELCTQIFITNDKPNVFGLILGGSADLKTELKNSDNLDNRLQAKILKLVDISYGGENGFNEAIEKASAAIQDVKYIQEQKIFQAYFDQIAQDTGKYTIGIDETMHALQLGACEIIICWENLPINRIEIKKKNSPEITVYYLTPEQEKEVLGNPDDLAAGDSEVVDKISFVEWIVNNYTKYGARLDIVTEKSQEGSQFINGFGGFGGILRYKFDTEVPDGDYDNAACDDPFGQL